MFSPKRSSQRAPNEALMADASSEHTDGDGLVSRPRARGLTGANQQVLDYIESTFGRIRSEIEKRPCGKPLIALKRITAVKASYDETDRAQLKWQVEHRDVTYSFPGKNQDEAWRFACVGRILREIHHAIRDGITVSKRDIYYRDPDLFRHQDTVDSYLDDIAHTCAVTRQDLNVTASPKGLVAGLNGTVGVNGTAVIDAPDHRAGAQDFQHLRWVLVIEKEATFRTLVEKAFHQHPLVGPGLLVTAKGYPDVATRRFLRRVVDQAPPSFRSFGLFDWDPDGIQILKCFLYGSARLAQEQTSIVPEMSWLGLKAEHLVSDPVSAGDTSLPLTARDRMAARSMLLNQEWRDRTGDVLPGLQEAVAELRRMLMLNVKAEIQVMDERAGGVDGWLASHLAQAQSAAPGGGDRPAA